MQSSKLAAVQVGQRVTVKRPQYGDWMAHALGRAEFVELWQTRRGPQSPWVPTGSSFTGLWLEGDLFLLNWQNRYYLLEERVELSDADIQTNFAPHAQKFARSDQKAEVYFTYPPAMWRMVDIGKFRVQSVEGSGLRLEAGAVGRFIHASGDSQRALVIEDYEGGGQDTAWIGTELQAEDIQTEQE